MFVLDVYYVNVYLLLRRELAKLKVTANNLTNIGSIYMTTEVHNQFAAQLCWCLALVTALHNALIVLMHEINLRQAEIDYFTKLMGRTHSRTVNEILLVVIPRNPERMVNPGGQNAVVNTAFERIAQPTILKVIYFN